MKQADNSVQVLKEMQNNELKSIFFTFLKLNFCNIFLNTGFMKSMPLTKVFRRTIADF